MSVITANPCNPAAARVAEYHNSNPLETIPGETITNPIIERRNVGRSAQSLEQVMESLNRWGMPYVQWLAIYRGIVTNCKFIADLAVRPAGNPGLPGFAGDDILTEEQVDQFETSKPREPELMLARFRAAGLGAQLELSAPVQIEVSEMPERKKRGRRWVWVQKVSAVWVRTQLGTSRYFCERELQNALKFAGLRASQVTFHRPGAEMCLRGDERCNPVGTKPGKEEPVCVVHHGHIVALVMPCE